MPSAREEGRMTGGGEKRRGNDMRIGMRKLVDSGDDREG
jgi:hypothetical protein